MPGTVTDSIRSAKRKRSASDKGSSKRARSESSEEDPQAQILLLENEIFESKKNYNNIARLIGISRDGSEGPDASILAAISLCRVFTKLMISGALQKTKEKSEKEIVVIRWLKERYSEYKTVLVEMLGQEDTASTALTLCMRMLKVEGQHLRTGQDYSFPTAFLTDMVQALTRPESDSGARKEFSEKFVEEYDDIRYFTQGAIQKILGGADSRPMNEGSFDSVYEILTSIASVPESKEELEDFYVPGPKQKNHALYSLTQHKKRAQEAWLAVMKMGMDKERRKRVLAKITDCIAPWFIQPELLMDFLTDSYNSGGSTSLLALSGVFYLIQEKNLDYPSFYRKLYSLLDSGLLHSKHRSRFFRLLDTFLSSTHLPVVLVASFLKRLSRLSLHAPPSGVVAVVPWIYNLLKKHPQCLFMIHRETRGAEAKRLLEEEGLADPFSMDEEDPMLTNAIDSSLWEIVTLQSHYHPNVATLAKIISEQFTKHAYNLEDFLDHSYSSMLEAELSKDVKKIPVVEYEIPKKIFMKHEADSGLEDSLLVKLWTFK
ncbi:cbf mak21 family protein [Rutstroemia sp. NJR-2017a WRK4]|nr:cbf mak21 family protein [Rutstroemia sp. NJR-2017a WRK4]